jgi:hypothetical protein
MEIVPREDPRVVALSAALEPYAWTKATPEMLARRAVGVLDRYWLVGELPGPRPAAWMDDVDPADPGDERVAVLVTALYALRWRMLTVPRCAASLSAHWSRGRCAASSPTSSSAGCSTAAADSEVSSLPGHRHPHLRLAVDDEFAAQVDGDLAQQPGEPER